MNHPIAVLLENLLLRAAHETSPGGPPWRVRRVSFERVSYDRSFEVRVDFGARERNLVGRISGFDLADRGYGCGRGDVRPPHPVDVQEWYEAILSCRAVEDALVAAQLASNNVVDISVAIDRINSIHPMVMTARDHLGRVRSHVLSRMFSPQSYSSIRFHSEMVMPSPDSNEFMQMQALAQERVQALQALMGQQFDEHFMGQVIASEPRWSKEAIERGWTLLRENLDKDQLKEFERHRYFHCIGGTTLHIYRICEGTQQNVYRCSAERGDVEQGFCFLPHGDLVIGDVMLAQKVALELDEMHALEVAHPFGVIVPQSRIPKDRLTQLNAQIMRTPIDKSAKPKKRKRRLPIWLGL